MNTILAFIFALELGFVPCNTQIDFINQDNFKGFTMLEAGFTLCDIVYVRGKAKTFIEIADTGYSFYPHQIDFTFDIGIKLDNISFGFRHTCFHPVFLNNNINNTGHLDRHEEIYLKIEGKINLF